MEIIVNLTTKLTIESFVTHSPGNWRDLSALVKSPSLYSRQEGLDQPFNVIKRNEPRRRDDAHSEPPS